MKRSGKRLSRLLLTMGLGCAVATLGFLAPSPANAAPPIPTDSLSVQESVGSTDLSYGYSRSFISGSSDTQAGKKNQATIDVNGKKFTVTMDKKTNTARWSGGGRTLDPADLSALQAMAAELHEQFLADAAGQRALSSDTELLIRATMLLAEAPAGVQLKDYVIAAPVVTAESPDEPGLPGPAAPDDRLCADDPGQRASGEMSIAACQVADDDGVYYWACAKILRSLYHDAANRCFAPETVNSGPGSSGSLGECGTGIVGIGTYTQDCGEHDRCGRLYGGSTNPWDNNCGDEYWDADDDYLWATINRC